MTTSDPSILEFLDYRVFVRAWLGARRARSIRNLARQIGVGHSFVSMVLSEQRALAIRDARRWGEALRLDPEGLDYWDAMVRFRHAETERLRAAAWHHMAAARDFHRARQAGTSSAAVLFERWYVPVILELARCPGFRPDPAWIAERLWPPAPAEEVQEALQLLVEHGVLHVTGDDVRVDESPLATPVDIADVDLAAAVRAYHLVQLRHAAEALTTLPADQRHFASTTVSIPHDRLPALVAALHRFHIEVIEPARPDGGDPPDLVVQVSVQLFPRARTEGSR